MMYLRILVVLFGVAVAGTGLCHTDEYLDTVQTPHGGQLRMTGPYHLELVVKDNEILVYMTDHGGNPVSTRNAKANATVLSMRVKTRVLLSPAANDVLRGTGPFRVAPNMKVVVRVDLPSQGSWLARFSPRATQVDRGPTRY